MAADSKTTRALLSELIDYAGLFPPAGLDMAAAVREYASYLAGEYSWMLGRFVVQAGRLAEFEKAASRYLGGEKWKIALLGRPAKPVEVDAVELRAERIRDIQPIAGAETYFEVTPALPLEATIEAIARAGVRAKIRTGGLTPEAFPEASRVARFLALCHKYGVAFKATAGLHHPVGGEHPFTYDPRSARGMMFGFVNLFLAAILIFNGGDEGDAAQLLEERSPNAFHFDNDAVCWRKYRITPEQIRQARERFAISFGSCSFEEPVRELEAMGLL
jgi:hypothetical protein